LKTAELLQVRPAGLYCPSGDFYIDPWSSVRRAIITHAHSDHARWGSEQYLAATDCRTLLELRLGKGISLQTLPYGEKLTIGSVTVSLHPAGHILGSSQVRIEVDGRVALITGDYKLQADPTCLPWEPVRCDLMVTESTFGLPVFRWPAMSEVVGDILKWWKANQAEGRTSVLLGYAVGKSQRMIAELIEASNQESANEMFIHGALIGPLAAYRAAGVKLPTLRSISEMPGKYDYSKSLIFAPPAAHNSPWMKRFPDASVAMASGWMAIRGTRRRRNVDRGFVVSDHVDWPDLAKAIELCNPTELWVTHGFSDVVARHQTELGRKARPIVTQFVGDDADVESEESSAVATPEQDERV
jgi:putative mRNA 3-end processing factor